MWNVWNAECVRWVEIVCEVWYWLCAEAVAAAMAVRRACVRAWVLDRERSERMVHQPSIIKRSAGGGKVPNGEKNLIYMT